MGTKELVYQEEARRALERGINVVADAVKTTLGPRGRNVVLVREWGLPIFTKDGVTVAKEIVLKNKFENAGAQLCREVASKTNDIAGDGTTTATVLAQAIVNRGMKYVTAGGNPLEVKRGIDKATTAIIQRIKELKVDIESREQIERVATIAGNDLEVGKHIAEAIEKVGTDGVITIEETRGNETVVTLVEGMQYDRGYISRHFVNNAETMTVDYEKANLLLVDKKINSIFDILPFMERYVKTDGRGVPLIIIAEDYSQDTLTGLVLNTQNGVFKNVAVKTPGFGERRKQMLEDIAVSTGATIVSDETGITFENCQIKFGEKTPSILGKARKVTVTKDSITIIEGDGDREKIDERCEQIKVLMEGTDSTYDREKFQERLSKLSGSVAIIEIGAMSEAELKEAKYRYDDALSATRAAIEEGIVCGGGVAPLQCIDVVEALLKDGTLTQDELMGVKIIREVLEAPITQIAKNAGFKADIWVDAITKGKTGWGYDARTGDYVDMHAAGIIDPAKVTRSAFENAASIASMVLTSEVMIADEPEPPMPMMQMMQEM